MKSFALKVAMVIVLMAIVTGLTWNAVITLSVVVVGACAGLAIANRRLTRK